MHNTKEFNTETELEEGACSYCLPISHAENHGWKSPFNICGEETPKYEFIPLRPNRSRCNATFSDSYLYLLNGKQAANNNTETEKETHNKEEINLDAKKSRECSYTKSPYQTILTPELIKHFKRLLLYRELDQEIIPECKVQLQSPNLVNKTLVLDLDGTLICNTFESPIRSLENSKKSEVVSIIHTGADKSKCLLKIYIRPYALQLLKVLNLYYEIIVFTSGVLSYAQPIVDYLDPEGSYISYVLHRQHCIMSKNWVIKDLRILSQRSLDKIIMVDNSVLSFANNMDNGIYVPTYDGDPNDNELLPLIGFLKQIANVDDVRPHVRQFANVQKLFEDYKKLCGY